MPMRSLILLSLSFTALIPATQINGATLTGTIRDDATGQVLPARLYIRAQTGNWHFARSAESAGRAVEYRKQRGDKSVEMHTALSAHPFIAELAAGKYTLTVEHGKEYHPAEREIDVGDQPINVELRLKRWINMAQQGWYSGDTHVHRTLDELPTAMLADDLNVALPLTYWVTKSDTPSAEGNRSGAPVEPKLIEVTSTNVIWPLNTEYEIFSVGEKRHTLGAVFGLGHHSVLARGAPPVKPIAEQVHREGGLLDLDKHNWPWSMMIVPVMKVDLYELSNKYIWRTEFGFRTWGEPIPVYMGLPRDPAGMDEKSWTEFGFLNYYALLNCGFRMMPTAGTASGVHPVPLGWGRVYVHCPQGFSYAEWMKGLAAGRSFVSTGPMMVVEVNGELPKKAYEQTAERATYKLTVKSSSPSPRRIEVLQAGRKITEARSTGMGVGAEPFPPAQTFEISVWSSTWLAVRCFETLPDGRERFAHSAPIFIDVPGKPLAPRKAEVEYLISRVKAEIARNTGVLSAEALAEYGEALAKYEELAKVAE